MNIFKRQIKRLVSESRYRLLQNYAWELRALTSKIQHRYQPLLFNDRFFLGYVLKKKIGFINNIESIKILALRGSTTDFGFCAPMIKDSYNLGLTNADLYTTYQLYNRYRGEMTNLKDVVIFVNPSVIGYFYIKTASRYLSVVYSHFFDISYPSIDTLEDKYLKKIYSKINKIEKEVGIAEDDYKGYETKSFLENIDVESRVETHLRENNREPDQIIYLEKLSKLISEDGRELLIVIPPFRSDYKALLPSEEIVFKKIFGAKLLSTKIVSYYSSSIFSDDDMGDTDHLNELGAKKITRLIAEILK